MACITCQGSKSNGQIFVNNSPTALLEKASELFHSGDYKIVKYNGSGYPHPVGSPTGVIVKDKISTYGIAQKGRFLLVHIDDISARPDVFHIVEENGEEYQEIYDSFNIVEEEEMEVSLNTDIVLDQSGNIVVEASDDGSVLIETIELLDEEENLIEEEIKPIKVRLQKKNALILKEFTKEYRFSHHLQVMGKIRSGELKSYTKNKKIYVYHDD